MKRIGNAMSLLVALLFTTSAATSQNFKVEGTCEGIADGTWLYLRAASPESKLDSSKVVGGRFFFSGNTESEITEVIIHMADYSNYVFFWLESKPMSITLKNGEFKKAIITGSDTQTENEKMVKLKEPINRREDSLSMLLSKTSNLQIRKDIQKEMRAVKDDEYFFYLRYVQQNPNSLNVAKHIDIYASTWGKEKTVKLYKYLSPAMKNTRYGQNIFDFITLNRVIEIGKRFVDFEQANVSGQNVRLSQILGKYTLLEFWASWCAPCREENPSLVETYNQFKDRGFVILGVSADDDKERWLKAVKDDQLTWENVSDLKGDKNKASLMYGIHGYPSNYLIDESGIIIATNLRGDALRKKLEELFK